MRFCRQATVSKTWFVGSEKFSASLNKTPPGKHEKNHTSGHEEGYPKALWKILRACPGVWKQTWQKPDTTQNTNASYDINVNTVWSLNELLPQVYELI